MRKLLVWYGILAISLGIIGIVCMNTANCMDVITASHNMSMRADLTSDPWMNAPHESTAKPVHSIDGSNANLRVATLNTINQLDSETIKVLQRTNTNNSMANLGGIGAVSLDSNSFVPGGSPALKTTDPFYLEMGARPVIDQSYLPIILRN